MPLLASQQFQEENHGENHGIWLDDDDPIPQSVKTVRGLDKVAAGAGDLENVPTGPFQ